MTFGFGDSKEKDLVNSKMKKAMNNNRSRKRIEKKLLKKVKKGKLTNEEMVEGLKKFDEAYGEDDER